MIYIVLLKNQHFICIVSPDSNCIKQGRILGEVIPEDEEKKNREKRRQKVIFPDFAVP